MQHFAYMNSQMHPAEAARLSTIPGVATSPTYDPKVQVGSGSRTLYRPGSGGTYSRQRQLDAQQQTQDSQTFESSGSFEAETEQAGPLGVPLWAWGLGVAGAAAVGAWLWRR